MEFDFSEINKKTVGLMESHVKEIILANGADTVEIDWITHTGHIRVHITYKGQLWTIATNSTKNRFNLGFGFNKTNNHHVGGVHVGYNEMSKEQWHPVQSENLTNVFKKMNSIIKASTVKESTLKRT